MYNIDATPAQIDALGRFYEHPHGKGWIERAKWQMNRLCFRTACHLAAWSTWAKQGLVEKYDVPGVYILALPTYGDGLPMVPSDRGKMKGRVAA